MSKQTLRSYCKSHLTLVWLCFIFTPLPVLWANPSLQYVSSFFLSCSSTFSFAHPAWPCDSAWTIQQCLLQPLFLRSSGFFLVSPPAVFVRNTVCQHLRKHLNKAWQGQSWRYGLPHSATFSFFHPHRLSHFSPLSSPPLYAPSFTLCISSTYLLSGPPLRSSYPPLQQMLLLSFTLFSCPPPVGDSIIFRHSWQCVAMFVCASLGSWPDFLVISMPTSFLTSPSSVAPDREITPVHRRCASWAKYRREAGRRWNTGIEGRNEIFGRGSECPAAAQTPREHTWGIDLHQKQLRVPETLWQAGIKSVDLVIVMTDNHWNRLNFKI